MGETETEHMFENMHVYAFVCVGGGGVGGGVEWKGGGGACMCPHTSTYTCVHTST